MNDDRQNESTTWTKSRSRDGCPLSEVVYANGQDERQMSDTFFQKAQKTGAEGEQKSSQRSQTLSHD